MKNNYVNKMIYKNNTVFLIIILAVTLSVAYFFKPYINNIYNNIYNYFCGPYDMKSENLLSIGELEDKGRFVENPLQSNFYINGNKFYYRITGYEPIKTGVKYNVYTYDNSNQRVLKNTYEYLLLKVEERYLIVRVPLDSKKQSFQVWFYL